MSDPLGYRVGVYQSVLDGLIWRQNLQLSKWARWDIHGFQNSINGYRGYVYLHPSYYHNLGPCLGLEVGIELPDYTQVTLLGFPKNDHNTNKWPKSPDLAVSINGDITKIFSNIMALYHSLLVAPLA